MSRILSYMLIGVALAIGSVDFFLIQHYGMTLPKSPRLDYGQVVAMNFHGTVVYLTTAQDRLIGDLQIAAVAIGGIGGVLLVRRRRR